MISKSPRCYIPSFLKIGMPVPEKIFKGILPYMGVAAILVMRSRCDEKNFVPPIQAGFTYNMALIGPAVSEKKMFEHCERRRRKTTDGRRTMGILQAHLLAFGSSGLISLPVVYCRRFQDGSSFGACSVARFHLIFGTVFLL